MQIQNILAENSLAYLRAKTCIFVSYILFMYEKVFVHLKKNPLNT